MNERADLKASPPKAIAGIGRVLMWQGGSLWIGHAAGGTQAHAHHAIQISVALTEHVRFRVPDGGWLDYTAAMIPPHQGHQFDGNGQSVAHVFVEPETVQGRALLARFKGNPIARLDEALPAGTAEDFRRAYASDASDDQLVALSRSVEARLAGGEAPLSVDPRITRAIEWMRARPKDPVTLAQVARVAHLSPGRFRHLFVAQTGTSFRAYLLWARVSGAVAAAMGGVSWTDAAQAWGFADSAHLTRTCRRMFGIAPSMLIRSPLAAGSDAT